MTKIVHLSVKRLHSYGQLQQLIAENKCSLELSTDCHWEVVAYDNKGGDPPWLNQLPNIIRIFPFLRLFFTYYQALRLSKDSDFVLIRHPALDYLGPLICIFNSKLIHYHHAITSIEMSSIFASPLRYILPPLELFLNILQSFSTRQVVAVTREIANHYSRLSVSKKHSIALYPNAFNYNIYKPTRSNYHDNQIRIAFACGFFAPWQGLDLLINDLVKDHSDTLGINSLSISFHLIGRIAAKDKQLISDVAPRLHPSLSIQTYDSLTHSSCIDVIRTCNIGLGSLALDREGLSESCSLKVREYLSLGIPVLCPYPDTSLPTNIVYYLQEAPTLNNIIKLFNRTRHISASAIHDHSRQFLHKTNAMTTLIHNIK